MKELKAFLDFEGLSGALVELAFAAVNILSMMEFCCEKEVKSLACLS